MVADLKTAHPQASWFGSIRLHNFRSYKECDLNLEPGVSVLYGANGVGKTNFLEALSLFSPGKGLRKAASNEFAFSAALAKPNAPILISGKSRTEPTSAWAVSARLTTPQGRFQMGTGLEPSKGERRILRVDGTTLKGQTQLPSYVSVLWLTPQMDSIFSGSVSERRGFLDQLVMALDPGHASELAAYLYSMRERARLLKQRRSGASVDDGWLTSLEDSMVRHGLAISASRRSYVRKLAPIFALGQPPFPGGSCSLDGLLERGLDDQKALELEETFRQQLLAARKRDQELGRATLGPHTTDLVVWNSDHGRLAGDCSTGEQKALLVALLLAHGQLVSQDRKRLPVYLLDEVAAHFDQLRREALFQALVDLGAQVFLTGTERSAFQALEGMASFFEVGTDSTIKSVSKIC